MKKPLVVWVTQASLVLIAISYGLLALLSVVGVLRHAFSAGQASGGVLVGLIIFGGAVTFAVATSRQKVARRSIVLFFWAVLVVYPLTNALSSAGLFPPKDPIPSNQLAGAAFAEGFRYLGLLALIVWLSYTKSAAEYLAAKQV